MPTYHCVPPSNCQTFACGNFRYCHNSIHIQESTKVTEANILAAGADRATETCWGRKGRLDCLVVHNSIFIILKTLLKDVWCSKLGSSLLGLTVAVWNIKFGANQTYGCGGRASEIKCAISHALLYHTSLSWNGTHCTHFIHPAQSKLRCFHNYPPLYLLTPNSWTLIGQWQVYVVDIHLVRGVYHFW